MWAMTFASSSLLLLLLGAPASEAASALAIEVRPDPVYVERAEASQLVNFDFVLTNRSAEPLTVGEITVSVLDRSGKLQARKFVNGNGARPSIDLVGGRTLEPGASQLVFNPLFTFERWFELGNLEYEFTYGGEDKEDRTAKVSVRPVAYEPKQVLLLPMAGRVLVWDRHDFLSHHRRFDYVLPMIRDFWFRTNVGRCGYDLVLVDEQGNMYRGDPRQNESWLGFGAPIYAVAGGTIVAAQDTRPDERRMDMGRLKSDHLEMFGNYVIVEHERGELALYGHIRQGSAAGKVGDRVRPGQRIASIGSSGSSIFPHLHFQLQTTANADGEGLPSYFGNFRRRLGRRTVPVERGQIDSGDIVEALPVASAP
jgi:hypothetical protein